MRLRKGHSCKNVPYKAIQEHLDKGWEIFQRNPIAAWNQHILPMLVKIRDNILVVMSCKKIPAQDMKTLRQFAKSLHGRIRFPKKADVLVKWIESTEIFLGTEKLSETESAQGIAIGDITLFDSLHLEQDALKDIERLIAHAVRLMDRSGVPHARSITYGPVVLVTAIQGENTLAWYRPDLDVINLRPTNKYGIDALDGLIHEFGHRLWRKFLQKRIQDDWTLYHRKLSMDRIDVGDMPKVGDILPFPVKGIDVPVVARIEHGKGYGIEYPDGRIGWFPSRVVSKRVLDEKISKRFPSRYAMTNEEEHFCEAFAQFCMGKLRKENQEDFMRILEMKDAPDVSDIEAPVMESKSITRDVSRDILNLQVGDRIRINGEPKGGLRVEERFTVGIETRFKVKSPRLEGEIRFIKLKPVLLLGTRKIFIQHIEVLT